MQKRLVSRVFESFANSKYHFSPFRKNLWLIRVGAAAQPYLHKLKNCVDSIFGFLLGRFPALGGENSDQLWSSCVQKGTIELVAKPR